MTADPSDDHPAPETVAASSRSSRPVGARRQSRLVAVQSLYQWLLSAEEPGAIEAFAQESEEFASADRAYYQDCFLGALRGADALRLAIERVLDRPLKQVSPVEHAILLLGSYELTAHPEVPYRVVINEGVELAKLLGGNEGHRYINGVLDRLAASLRPDESRG